MNRRKSRKAAGFSMIEVLVTMAVVAIGLIGLAKMQAAALSNTQVARVRSLVALQLDSLASAMHGNKAFWQSGAAPTSWGAAGTTITDSSGVLNKSNVNCVGTTSTCDAKALAAYDVQQWASGMNTQFPGYTASATCQAVVGQPVSCAISVSWNEKYVAINRSTAASGVQGTSTQWFTLQVQP